MSESKSLVLCADDYALNADVSAGIVQLARQGRLSATSVMVLSPRWAQDAPVLRELAAHIDVGLHLDWTSDFAQTAGHGASLSAIMWRAVKSPWDATHARAQVREAIERQLDAFEAHWHRAPDHVDGHQHVHQFAGIRQPLIEVLQRRYGADAKRPWLRISQVAQPGVKSLIISAWGASALRRWAQATAWPHVAPLMGVYDFTPDAAVYAQHMRTWLQHMPDTALLMCHPASKSLPQGVGLVQEPGRVDDAIHQARGVEFTYLHSAAFAEALQQAQVRLLRPSSGALKTVS